MSNHSPTPIYSQNNATGTGTGLTVDLTAFTESSSVCIIITGTATVRLEGNVDYTNDNTWVDCSNGGYTGTVWVTVPERVPYMRTRTTSFVSGLVTSIFCRGISENSKSVVSAQHPVTSSTGAQ